MNKGGLLRGAAFLSSREAGFLFSILGVIVQGWHSYFIAYKLSSLGGGERVAQALLMALFLSGPLLYFTLKAGATQDAERAAKYRRMVNIFAYIDSFANLWYYIGKLIVYPWPEAQWFEIVIAIPISFLLPIILKCFAGEVFMPQEVSKDDLDVFKAASEAATAASEALQIAQETKEMIKGEIESMIEASNGRIFEDFNTQAGNIADIEDAAKTALKIAKTARETAGEAFSIASESSKAASEASKAASEASKAASEALENSKAGNYDIKFNGSGGEKNLRIKMERITSNVENISGE